MSDNSQLIEMSEFIAGKYSETLVGYNTTKLFILWAKMVGYSVLAIVTIVTGVLFQPSLPLMGAFVLILMLIAFIYWKKLYSCCFGEKDGDYIGGLDVNPLIFPI